MKLNYKKTMFVGLAFFLISLFWQAYDSIIPKILTDKFGMSHFWSGAIMAIDNILALFMLPLFGSLSDKTKTKRGRRTPFILFGTIVAAVALIGLSCVDSMQLRNIDEIAAVVDRADGDYEEAMGVLYDADVEYVVEGERATLSESFTKEEFVGKWESIKAEIGYVENDDEELDDQMKELKKLADDEYARFETEYVNPARQAYAAEVVTMAPSMLVIFICVLLVVLLAMATFRSPAVALMPDVTVKPLRSKANAIINLMGTFGGIIVLVLGMIFGTGKPHNALMNYIPFLSVVGGIMLVALVIFIIKVNEPKLVREMEEDALKYGISDVEEEEKKSSGGKLTKAQVRSLLFILASVIFWYMGYNAVTSKYSVYAVNVLQLDYNVTLIVAQFAAVVAYVPAGIVASKIGRRKTILAGIVFLSVAFFGASFMAAPCNIWLVNALFILAGIGWATINVNSYPMVVELSSSGDVGKYTGFYYTASMTAQTVTPMLSGLLLDVNMRTLFPYATVFVVLAFFTMLCVRHGDAAPTQKKEKLEAFDVD